MKLVLGSRNGRMTRRLVGVMAILVGLALASACGSGAPSGGASSAGGTSGQSTGSSAGQTGSQASSPGTVQLHPASGPTSTTPTWSTSVACPSGYQGSAVFSEIYTNGKTFSTIAPVVNGTNVPFKGTLLTTVAEIQSIAGIANGATQELFVQCASNIGGTGSVLNYMKTYITYSADGKSYTTSGNP
jgi:hypothetical protein